jgi:hypothetical protein
VIFVVGLVAADRVVAQALRALATDVRTGEQIGLVQRALASRDRDVLVFGSSRAKRHVDPEVIEAESGLRAYNGGVLGQGLPYARMLEALLLDRGTAARVFVLQLDPVDLFADRTARAGMFAVFYGEVDAVDRILEERDRFARLKLLSHAYRFNSLGLSILRHRVAPADTNPLGFEPRRGQVDPAQAGPDAAAGLPIGELLPRMEAMLRAFLGDARRAGVRCVVTVGPRYRAGIAGGPPAEWELAGLDRMAAIAREEGARFAPLDERVEAFMSPALYADRAHLNARGAAIFSRLLAEEIRLALADRP